MKVCLSCGDRFSALDWKCPACGKKPGNKGAFTAFSPELSADNDLFPAEGFSRLARLEEGNFWFRSRNRLIQWVFKEYFPSARDFFEVGCGTGFVLWGIERVFPEVALFGSEVYADGLSFAAQRLGHCELFQMDARHIPFEAQFDVMGAFDVLEHIPEDEAVLGQMFQAVKPGGGIIVTVPQHAFLWSRVDEYTHHVRRYSRSELKAKVEKAGFRILRVSSYMSLLLPLMALSRFLDRKSKKALDPEGEFRIHPLVNSALEAVLKVELFLTRLGVDLPMGGSLFLAARKA